MHTKFSVSLACVLLAGCGNTTTSTEAPQKPLSTVKQLPASKFDLSHWYLTVPLDEDNDQVSDIYDVPAIKHFSHSDFFYLDENNHLVFATPNRAATERTSTNTRSELRYMIRGNNVSIPEGAPSNNFALAANKSAEQYASVGGKLTATLHVDHVAQNAGYPHKPPAYSVVVGQVHSFQLDDAMQVKNGQIMKKARFFGPMNETLPRTTQTELTLRTLFGAAIGMMQLIPVTTVSHWVKSLAIRSIYITTSCILFLPVPSMALSINK